MNPPLRLLLRGAPLLTTEGRMGDSKQAAMGGESLDGIRVLVVARDPLVLSSLASRLGQEPSVRSVLAARSFKEARALLEEGPHGRPLGCGIRGGGSLLEAEWPPSPAVLMLVPDVRSAGFALTHGVKGALLRERETSDIVAGLHCVARGLYALDPEIAKEHFALERKPALPPEALTPREHEVLKLMAEGLANKAIAQRLSITEHTAKFHVNAVLQKLNVDGRTGAVVRAARLGWISL